jgi:hypothetical protein
MVCGLLQVFISIMFLSYQIKKLKVFYFQSLLNDCFLTMPISYSVKYL